MKIPDDFIEQKAEEYINCEIKPSPNFAQFLNYAWYMRCKYLELVFSKEEVYHGIC